LGILTRSALRPTLRLKSRVRHRRSQSGYRVGRQGEMMPRHLDDTNVPSRVFPICTPSEERATYSITQITGSSGSPHYWRLTLYWTSSHRSCGGLCLESSRALLVGETVCVRRLSVHWSPNGLRSRSATFDAKVRRGSPDVSSQALCALPSSFNSVDPDSNACGIQNNTSVPDCRCGGCGLESLRARNAYSQRLHHQPHRLISISR